MNTEYQQVLCITVKKIKTIILRNELKDDHDLWIKACEEYKGKIEYRVVNLTSYNWLEDIQKESFDVLLAKPGGSYSTIQAAL